MPILSEQAAAQTYEVFPIILFSMAGLWRMPPSDYSILSDLNLLYALLSFGLDIYGVQDALFDNLYREWHFKACIPTAG